MPWTFFQESVSDGVNSVVGNTALIKKIYFPREIFPLTSVFTKLVELGINFVILAGLDGLVRDDSERLHPVGARHYRLHAAGVA